MLKKTITYTDFNDVERTEDFYFNLTRAELTEMQLTIDGGYSAYVQKIVNSKDVPSLIKIFKDLIFRTYGVKSDDGRRFIKSEQLSIEFSQTEAYNKLFMELATNDEAAAQFVKGVIPQDLAEEVEKESSSSNDNK